MHTQERNGSRVWRTKHHDKCAADRRNKPSEMHTVLSLARICKKGVVLATRSPSAGHTERATTQELGS